jgi:hypothetical protein
MINFLSYKKDGKVTGLTMTGESDNGPPPISALSHHEIPNYFT